VNVYSIGKERLYLTIGAAIAIVAITLAVVSWSRQKDKLLQAQTDLRNSQVQFEVVQGKLVQAENSKVLQIEDLKKTLSTDFQTKLEAQKLDILNTIRTKINFKGGGGGTGTGGVTPEGKPTLVFDYPGAGVKDDLMKNIHVDASKDSTKPDFKYTLKPFSLTLESALLFDKKDGVTRFWAQPVITSIPTGLEVEITDMELHPSPEFNRWVTEISGKKTTIAVPAKYSVNLLLGKEFAAGLLTPRTVYGAQVQYNWSNGAGAGAGVIGNTTFISAGYSWGRH
jgi:hypothetical protein